MGLSVLVAVFAAVALAQSGQDDLVTSLPGVATMPSFRIYAGYLTINATSGKQFFYTYVEAAANPSTAPLVRWFNGGPGCSSLGGMFQELGPLIPAANGTLVVNPYSWNGMANMLFIESPCGVGFSFSKTDSDYTSSDASTAADNYVALQQFLVKFPELSGRDLWLAGESYAGHYIPTCAAVIMDKPLGLNFRGFATGNPTTNIQDDFYYGTWKTWAMRGLISRPTWLAIKQHCRNVTFLQPPAECQTVLDTATAEMGSLFNPYDLDAPMCASEEQNFLVKHIHKAMGLSFPAPLPYLPCEDQFIQQWVNLPETQAALHVQPNTTQGGWSDCVIDKRWNYDYSGFYNSQLPVYTRALAAGLKVVTYSGTADTVVPYLGTSRWVFNLMNGTAPDEAWHSWTTPEHPHQAAGFTVRWGSFRFVTIRNAGHLVPQKTPEQAYSILQMLLN